MGNGPSAVRITTCWFGTNSTISYVYSRRRPRNSAMNATREPTRIGGAVFHSTDLMFTYQSGARDGSPAYAATSATGLLMTMSVITSTGMVPSPDCVSSGED